MMKKTPFHLKILNSFYPSILVLFGFVTGYLEWKMVLFGYLSFCLYVKYTSNTYFYYKDCEKNRRILSSSTILKNSNFKPHFLLPTAFSQLILFPLISTSPEKLNLKEKEKVNDFGSSLIWGSFSKEAEKCFKTEDDINMPILIVLPGITGDDSDNYINRICYEGLKNNYKVVIYNNRMLSDQIVLHPEIHLDLIEEFESAVSLIEKKYPERKIFAIGFSYGANKLLNFLGTRNLKDGKNRISAAVSLSNPFDLKIGQRFLHDTIYDTLILSFLKDRLKNNYDAVKKYVKDYDLEIDKALNAESVIEYDEHVVRRILRYKTPDHYYDGISCVHHLSKIKIPTLCINALDDNITTSRAIPYDEIRLNENLILLTTDTGGHLVWIDDSSIFRLNQWVLNPAIDFLNTVRKLNL